MYFKELLSMELKLLNGIYLCGVWDINNEYE